MKINVINLKNEDEENEYFTQLSEANKLIILNKENEKLKRALDSSTQLLTEVKEVLDTWYNGEDKGDVYPLILDRIALNKKV